MNERHNQSILKAAAILDVLHRSGVPMSLAELSKQLGWAKSTTYGLLSTLTSISLVEQRQYDGKYVLGIRLFEYGCAVSASRNITAIARPYLEHMALETGESAFVATLDGLDSVLLNSAETGGNLKIVSALGTRSPLYCNSSGKVLLAYQPAGAYQQIVRKLRFKHFTPHTTCTPEALAKACEEIRRQGYCMEKGEYRMGLCSVSAPVFDHNRQVKYAFGVAGMFQDVHTEAFQKVISGVCEAAANISHEMGLRE